ncbi:metal ABC transporter ATP-binding protein [Promethearchaeum syntrophicum]|uniref:Metal ABC transporter ATP-binding protein n=1 Tax=Promethearchaeum syntrophicum TaxID=2594042 RepID=A0A5B9D8G0_9ARCH|nr:ABC transporter ATP-binding protein [Candidatus Prometheoarchaeum syntrophicum]QEE15050.1 Cobalamin import ATP-binding protein BtuD [Candidatus Prometheoarchaeum syntrophicum]
MNDHHHTHKNHNHEHLINKHEVKPILFNTTNISPIIELERVSVNYGKNVILKGIDLKIYRGEYIGLIGKNGSGKSTLMKSILGLIHPESGTIKVFGNPIQSEMYDKIGYVPQMHPIQREFPATVGDIVGMGLYKKNLFKPFRKEDKDRIKLALHKVNMGSFFDRPIGHLSGGEQQKVLVAQALVRDPEILLLDEPTSALDFTMVENLLKLLQDLNQNYGLTLIVIQHNLEILRPYCSRLIMLMGSIMYDGLPNIPRADELIKRVF